MLREGLLWLASLSYQNVEVESDSLLAVQAITRPHDNILEVGYALDECRSMIQSRSGVSITFAKRQANKAAHLVARLPCLLGCQSIFTSPPDLLLETLLSDSSS